MCDADLIGLRVAIASVCRVAGHHHHMSASLGLLPSCGMYRLKVKGQVSLSSELRATKLAILGEPQTQHGCLKEVLHSPRQNDLAKFIGEGKLIRNSHGIESRALSSSNMLSQCWFGSEAS